MISNILPLILFGLIVINLNSVHLVDRSNFKSCKESGFCLRHRSLKADNSKWQLIADTIKVVDDSTRLEGHLKHSASNVVLKLELFGLLDDANVFRLRIDELNSDRQRFEAKDALLDTIKNARFSNSRVGDNSVEVTLRNHKAVLNYSPFRLDLYSDNELILSGNQRGLFRFEHYRTKNEGGDNPVDDDIEGANTMWEETFKTWTDSKPYGPMSVGMDFSFVGFDHVYGIPEHADDFALKNTKEGDPYRLYNLDVFEYELSSPMALYGATPMMLAHSADRTIGIVWLNPSETWIDIEPVATAGSGFFGLASGDKKSRPTHWFSETGVVDVFFMLGPKPVDVMKQNAKLFGTTNLPPYYSIGHHQCRWNYFSQDEVNEVDLKFDENDIPLDAIWLDIEYTAGRSKKYFTWDEHMFSDPKGLISNLTSKGRRLITIIDPHLKKDSDYAVYNEAVQNNYLVKTKEGNDYEGWCWPGASMYADFTNPKVREWWASKFNPEFFPGYEGGVVDIWNDMNEPSVFNGPEVTAPKDVKHVDGFEHRDIHNMYGFLMTKATYEGLTTHRPNLRPFILTRSFFAGSQRYCAVWTGDNMAKWDHLKAVVPMLLSLSVVGMTFGGADVPGFFFNPEDEELVVRWYQTGAFQPFYRAHAHLDTRRREPWEFSDATRKAIRSTIRTRYTYLPYLYTLFYENTVNGMPIMQPLWFQFPDDVNTFSIDDAYMLGDALLIHPITRNGVTSEKIYFPGKPEDTWLDLKTNKLFNGGNEAIIQVDLESMPYYQRSGTIIPKRERYRRAAALTLDDPISLDIVLNADDSAAGHVYLDDGYTFDYRTGNYNYGNFTFNLIDKTSSQISYTVEGNLNGKVWLERVTIYQFKRKPNIVEGHSNNERVSLQYRYDQYKQILIIRKPGFQLNQPWTIEIN